MIYIKWLLLTMLDYALAPVWFIAAPFLSLFTAKRWPSWGDWFWTYDNPPPGDAGYQRERAPYCPASNQWQLYVNRVFWLWRNPGYGFQKSAGIKFGSNLVVKHIGDDRISDKYRRPGWYFARCFDADGNVIAFELYAVMPWSDNKCIRARIGWKIMTEKFSADGIGFAPLVNTINPFKGYGT